MSRVDDLVCSVTLADISRERLVAREHWPMKTTVIHLGNTPITLQGTRECWSWQAQVDRISAFTYRNLMKYHDRKKQQANAPDHEPPHLVYLIGLIYQIRVRIGMTC